ncbi:cysteine-rich motor neuron 1 protein-like [Diabrotica virgifera virgifera]|uniref:Cysteine-rich motor neuron 1 protein-like n=1 Tax=Diabrotica virgifera virgifera TaxID=50390 RepID=A0A6P7G8B8_DIAVI|nr:cysteine-rich motor neuron 1 protein-like [Diabrotica virgifera virgifera]
MIVGSLFLILLSTVHFGNSYVCPPCDEKTVCEPLSCPEGQKPVPKWSCNCCDTCLTVLKEGDNCSGNPFLGVPSKVVCDTGLICYKSKCTNEEEVAKILSQ